MCFLFIVGRQGGRRVRCPSAVRSTRVRWDHCSVDFSSPTTFRTFQISELSFLFLPFFLSCCLLFPFVCCSGCVSNPEPSRLHDNLSGCPDHSVAYRLRRVSRDTSLSWALGSNPSGLSTFLCLPCMNGGGVSFRWWAVFRLLCSNGGALFLSNQWFFPILEANSFFLIGLVGV